MVHSKAPGPTHFCRPKRTRSFICVHAVGILCPIIIPRKYNPLAYSFIPHALFTSHAQIIKHAYVHNTHDVCNIKHNVSNDCRVAAKFFDFFRLKVNFLIQCNGNFKKVGQITQKVGLSRTFYGQSRTFSIFLQKLGQMAQK